MQGERPIRIGRERCFGQINAPINLLGVPFTKENKPSSGLTSNDLLLLELGCEIFMTETDEMLIVTPPNFDVNQVVAIPSFDHLGGQVLPLIELLKKYS